jgi:16S rRNA (adenine(1408)-N(1))-methyltransferase
MDYSLNKLNFEKNILDIGTGDGRYVYKNALANPNTLYLGIDPASNLKEYQREINRKKIRNAVLINSSIENFNLNEVNTIDQINIILPWGNLLKYVVTVDNPFFEKIFKWLSDEAKVQIIFGFNEELEEKETKRLNLAELTEQETNFIKNKYQNLQGYKLIEFKQLTNKDLINFETSWAKKLSFGKNRKYLYIELKKI